MIINPLYNNPYQMKGNTLEEISAELDISREDIRSIRWEHWRQRWIYPIIGMIFALGATIIGYLSGKEDTYYIDGEPQGYPFSMTVVQAAQPFFSIIPFAFLVPIIGSVTHGTFLDKRQRMIINAGILLVFLIVGITGYVIGYEYGRPEVRRDMGIQQGQKYGVWHQ